MPERSVLLWKVRGQLEAVVPSDKAGSRSVAAVVCAVCAVTAVDCVAPALWNIQT